MTAPRISDKAVAELIAIPPDHLVPPPWFTAEGAEVWPHELALDLQEARAERDALANEGCPVWRYNEMCARVEEVTKERDEARVDNARLRVEIERIANGGDHRDGSTFLYRSDLRRIARAALAEDGTDG